MKTGLAAIIRDGRFGMPALHMEALLAVAEAQGVVIGVRPVSKFARCYLEAGYPTKPFAVKNKSSKVGIAAGLIVMNPEYSQVNEGDYGKHWEQLKSAFHKDERLVPVNLVMTLNQIMAVKILLGEKITIQQNGNGDYNISWEKNGKLIQMTATKQHQGETYELFNEHGVPVRVLGKKVNDKDNNESIRPVTADYDLLVVCPLYRDFDPGKMDKTPLRTQGSPDVMFKQVARASSSDYIGPREDLRGGNWSQRTQSIVNAINIKIAELDINRQGQQLETVHHNNEFHNPFADELENNMPCLIVLPIDMNLTSMDSEAKQVRMVLIEDTSELEKIRKILLHEGYHWSPHAKYTRQGSFDMLGWESASRAIQEIFDKRRANSSSQLFQHGSSEQKDDSEAHPEQPSSNFEPNKRK